MIPEYHQSPYNEISIEVKYPKDFINELIKKYETLEEDIKKDEELFPGDTNFVGNSLYEARLSIESILYFLKNIQNESL
jgi:hypothetical protein